MTKRNFSWALRSVDQEDGFHSHGSAAFSKFSVKRLLYEMLCEGSVEEPVSVLGFVPAPL